MHINYILVNKQMSLFKQVIGCVEDNLFERNRLKNHLKTAEKICWQMYRRQVSFRIITTSFGKGKEKM